MAAIVKELVAAGLQGDDLVAALGRIEAAATSAAPQRTARQERNARYYEKRASEKRLKASYQDVSDANQDVSDAKDGSPRAHVVLGSSLPSEVQREEKKERKNIVQPLKKIDYSPEFMAWYARFPRHEAKGDALKAFISVRKSGVPLDVLLAGADSYAARGLEPKYTKLPASWLRGSCWEDVPHVNGSTGPPPASKIFVNMPEYQYTEEELAERRQT